MLITSLYTCSRCKKEFNFNNIRYDDDHSLICVDCLGKKQKLANRGNLKLDRPEKSESIKFICVNCRFKFSIKKDSQKTAKCPYCGKTKLMLIKRYKDEDDLIRDSMDQRFSY